jgi:hypothetical protein
MNWKVGDIYQDRSSERVVSVGVVTRIANARLAYGTTISFSRRSGELIALAAGVLVPDTAISLQKQKESIAEEKARQGEASRESFSTPETGGAR